MSHEQRMSRIFEPQVWKMSNIMSHKQGSLTAIPDAEAVVRPLADGGEGTTDALILGLGGERVTLPVAEPDGRAVTWRRQQSRFSAFLRLEYNAVIVRRYTG